MWYLLLRHVAEYLSATLLHLVEDQAVANADDGTGNRPADEEPVGARPRLSDPQKVALVRRVVPPVAAVYLSANSMGLNDASPAKVIWRH